MSPSALAKLASALQLSAAERAYLFKLAGKRNQDDGGSRADPLPAAALGCVHAIESPAYILDRSWNARSWNTHAERLFVGWLDRPGECNLLRFIFLQPVARSLFCGWEERARRTAAEFRANSAYLSDPSLCLLINGLYQGSSEFARFWDESAVLGQESCERVFNHPEDGLLRYAQITFHVVGCSDLRLTMLVQTDGNFDHQAQSSNDGACLLSRP